MHNALTAMSFEDQGNYIRSKRITKYLTDRVNYESHVKIYAKQHKSSLINNCNIVNQLESFSEMDDFNSYNYTKQFSDQTVINIFAEHVEKNQKNIEKLQDEIDVGEVCSVDGTFNIQKRTSVLNLKTNQYDPVQKNAFVVLMNAYNQVIDYVEAKDADTKFLKQVVENALQKCNQKKQKFPKYFCTDNCCNDRNAILEVYKKFNSKEEDFPIICLDLKHFINRFLEQCSQRSSLYSMFSKELHSAVTGKLEDEMRINQTFF